MRVPTAEHDPRLRWLFLRFRIAILTAAERFGANKSIQECQWSLYIYGGPVTRDLGKSWRGLSKPQEGVKKG